MSNVGGGELGDFAPIETGSYEIVRVSASLAIEVNVKVMRGEVENAYCEVFLNKASRFW